MIAQWFSVRVLRIMSYLLLGGLAFGCASPSIRMDRLAAQAGYQRGVVEGSGFRHVVYTPVRRPWEAKRLHIYIGSDGTPWIDGNRVSTDPTPRNPLALRLMSADPAFTIYVGRPCYHGTASDEACTSRIWTTARYSRQVVASMASAISQVISNHRSSEVVLIGYSGGGTLAVLLARELAGLDGVITIAGNLDVAAWSESHGYLPLTESLDPAGMRTAGGMKLPFVHLVGSDDRTVPPRLTETYAAGRRCQAVIVLEGYDHSCCWEKRWPETLRRAEERLRSICE